MTTYLLNQRYQSTARKSLSSRVRSRL